MTETTDALLPCPCCKGQPDYCHFVTGTAYDWYIRCPDCKLEMRRRANHPGIDDPARAEVIKLWNTRTPAATPASEGCIKWPDYMTAADFHFLKGLRVFITSREKIFQPTGVEMFDDLIARLEAGFATCGVAIND